MCFLMSRIIVTGAGNRCEEVMEVGGGRWKNEGLTLKEMVNTGKDCITDTSHTTLVFAVNVWKDLTAQACFFDLLLNRQKNK